MKENEFLDGLSNIESDVVERFVLMDNKLKRKANKTKPKGTWIRFGAIAACFMLIVGVIIVLPMLRGDVDDTTTGGDGRRFRTADTLEEYNDFMEKFVFSNSFVTYDSLSDLGEFDKFYIHYFKGAKEDHTEEELALEEFSEEYHYTLKNKDGSKLSIYVLFAPEFDSGTDESTEYQHLEECPESFLTSEWEGLEYKGVYYKYQSTPSGDSGQRKLTDIIFHANGNYINILTWQMPLSDYFTDDIMAGDNLLSCLIKGNPDNVDLAVKYLNAPPISIEERDNGEIYVNDTLIEKEMPFYVFVDILDRYSNLEDTFFSSYFVFKDTFDNDKLYMNFVTKDGLLVIDFMRLDNNPDFYKEVQIDDDGNYSIKGVEIGKETTYAEFVELIGKEGLSIYHWPFNSDTYLWQYSELEYFAMYYDKDGNSCFTILNREEISSSDFVLFY